MRTRSTIVGTALAVITLAAGVTACKANETGHASAPAPSPSHRTGNSHSAPSAPPVASSGLSSASPAPSASTTPKKPGSSHSKPPSGPSGNPTYTVVGFPSAATTGYPHGLAGDSRKPVTLAKYTGPMTITQAGTVIDGKDITGMLTIKTKNVVIKNSRIRVANTQAVKTDDGDNNLLIEDSELDGQGKDASTGGLFLVGTSGYTLLRVNAHDQGDIVRMDGHATIQDSWLHDPSGTQGSQHNDVIQSTNADYIRILHNRLENPHTQTSCILLKADIGNISNVVVDSNLFNGGGYAFYWYDANDHSHRISNGKVTNNRWLRSPAGGYFAKGGLYGPVATLAYEMPQWSGNSWEDAASSAIAP